MDKLRILEEEQEMLNSSLIALTTHFAQVLFDFILNKKKLLAFFFKVIISLQVQFRLKQICDAPTNKKEELLKELEEFAFRGIPDIQSNLIFNTRSSTPSTPSHNHDVR